jgi:hypothetical protein
VSAILADLADRFFRSIDSDGTQDVFRLEEKACSLKGPPYHRNNRALVEEKQSPVDLPYFAFILSSASLFRQHFDL